MRDATTNPHNTAVPICIESAAQRPMDRDDDVTVVGTEGADVGMADIGDAATIDVLATTPSAPDAETVVHP